MRYRGPEQRGSMAAETASRNPYGQYLRARVGRGGTPLYSIGDAAQSWSHDLTDDQRLAWQTWAAEIERTDSLGQVNPWSGREAYIAQFQGAARALGNMPVLVDAPLSWSRPVLTDLIVTDATVTLWSVTVDRPCHVEITTSSYPAAEHAGVSRPPGRGRWWRVMDISGLVAVGPVGFAVVPVSWPSGSKVWARVRAWDGETRLRSPWLLGGPVVAP